MTAWVEASPRRRAAIVLPLLIGLFVGVTVVGQRHPASRPSGFCDEVATAVSQFVQSTGGDAAARSLVDDPPALARVLEQLHAADLVAALPASLRGTGRLLARRLPALIARLNAAPVGVAAIKMVPPDVLAAIGRVSAAYQRRCQ